MPNDYVTLGGDGGGVDLASLLALYQGPSYVPGGNGVGSSGVLVDESGWGSDWGSGGWDWSDIFGGSGSGTLGGSGGSAGGAGGGSTGFWSNPTTQAALASALGSAFSAYMGSRSANKTADLNAQLVREANATNERLFRESRGSTGSAVLPLYLADQEVSLARRAAEVSNSLFNYGGGVNNRLNEATRYLTRYNPALDAGDKTVMDVATGAAGAGRRASLAPVLDARSRLGRSKAASITQSLDETLASIRAQRAHSGFRGNSTFDTNRAIAGTTAARAGAAEAIGAADLENALASHQLGESNLQLQLNSLDMPFTRAQQRLAFNSLPIRTVGEEYSNAMAPLNFFRLPTANPPAQQVYQRPNITSGGEIAGAAVAAGAQSIGQMLAQQQLMREMSKWFGAGAAPGTAIT